MFLGLSESIFHILDDAGLNHFLRWTRRLPRRRHRKCINTRTPKAEKVILHTCNFIGCSWLPTFLHQPGNFISESMSFLCKSCQNSPCHLKSHWLISPRLRAVEGVARSVVAFRLPHPFCCVTREKCLALLLPMLVPDSQAVRRQSARLRTQKPIR